jgi:hypothetical protein
MTTTDVPPAAPPVADKLRLRFGAFSVSSDLVDIHPEAVLKALAGCVIVRAEMIYHERAFHYVALCEDFDIVPEGDVTPHYACLLTEHADGGVTRAWQPADRPKI